MDLFGKLDLICELFKNQDNDKFDCFIHLFYYVLFMAMNL